LSKQPVSSTDVGTPLSHLKVSIQEDLENHNYGHGEIVVTVGANVISTQDLGYFDPSTKRLQVLGRLDDLINVSGLKVIPSEIESIIMQMPGIKETIVLRTEHKVWGEAVKAVVVAESSIVEKDIRLWCINHLPTYKVPSVIEITTVIPRTPAGKISRRFIQEKGKIQQ
jgi:3,4-dihydroxybenzoate---[aryl-carrier protein] ligase